MLLKAGVDISRLRPEIRKKLNAINQVYVQIGESEMVVTSTYEGNHSPGSLHYANLAIDLRLPANYKRVARAIQTVLGSDYDVVIETSHIHIEYDPKGGERNGTNTSGNRN